MRHLSKLLILEHQLTARPIVTVPLREAEAVTVAAVAAVWTDIYHRSVTEAATVGETVTIAVA